ncbi:thymidine kinase [Georgenia halophila]|uniref:Thymidine kinase n=1 Tax=Georgenia halophila TaxID=620889 RepID=A0ABP8LRS7_9MICO
MAELVFFSGTMDSGKSTLALQTDHNHAARGLAGLIFSRNDRAGHNVLSSRLGLSVPAVEVTDATDFWAEVVRRRTRGNRVDYLICDEVQFYSPVQIEQLARLVDEIAINVFGFGISTDFRTKLFPGSARMLELADRVEPLQVEALCWCGVRATHNARTVGGVMVTEGEQVVVGNVSETGGADDVGAAEAPTGQVGYEVLCRRHHLRRLTAAVARPASLSPQTLPLDED